MSTEIKYDTSSEKSIRKAIIDANVYMGSVAFKMIVRAIKHGAPRNEIYLATMLVGVRGFPVTAMLDRYSPNS